MTDQEESLFDDISEMYYSSPNSKKYGEEYEIILSGIQISIYCAKKIALFPKYQATFARIP